MEPEGSLLCSQEPATGPRFEPEETNPHLPPYFPKIHFNQSLYTFSFFVEKG
jgi:hypothetical protein